MTEEPTVTLLAHQVRAIHDTLMHVFVTAQQFGKRTEQAEVLNVPINQASLNGIEQMIDLLRNAAKSHDVKL